MQRLFVHFITYFVDNYHNSLNKCRKSQQNILSRYLRLLRCNPGYLPCLHRLPKSPAHQTQHNSLFLNMQEDSNDREQLAEDPVSGSSIQENHGEQVSDPWAVSRREATRAFLGLFLVTSLGIVFHRSKLLRRFSFAAFFGHLRNRIPTDKQSLWRFTFHVQKAYRLLNISTLRWINVEEPPPILDNKLLVVFLWRSSDISNPDYVRVLQRISVSYPQVAVVAIHTPKFDYEIDSHFVRIALEGFDMNFPCALDSDWQVWKSIGAKDWPTVLVLDPNYHILFAIPKNKFHLLEDCITTSLDYFSEYPFVKGAIAKTIKFSLDPMERASPLCSPGKIALDLKNGRLFISDSGHHRILIVTMEGQFLDQIGGLRVEDDFILSEKERMIYNEEYDELVIADMWNDAIRIAHLKQRQVRTTVLHSKSIGVLSFSGTSECTFRYPMDVTIYENTIFAVAAGSNEIWSLNPSGEVKLVCGNGKYPSGHIDTEGDLSRARLCAPSGITVSPNGTLYVVDSDSSIIRWLSMTKNQVGTLVGGDAIFTGNLSAFGDRNGVSSSVRLQRPMGICYMDKDQLIVADTFNHKLKCIHTIQRDCRWLCGDSQLGYVDGPKTYAKFHCPCDVAWDPISQRLYIVDRENHVIRWMDWNSNGIVHTLQLFGFPTWWFH
ncbi:NHL repeat-containing protein 2 [Galdieria sulphuraria]|nr:NHL repeat-containing protein 2 [Galdieria sulphuraria]